MFNSITSLFKQLLDGQDLAKTPVNNPNLAIACLLCEVAGADNDISDSERSAKQHLIEVLLDLPSERVSELIDKAEEQVKDSASLYEFTTQLRELSQETRFELIKAMWEVASADGEIDPLEDSVIRKTAELLYVDHSEFIRAKLSVVKD
ncbi:TerB family tellurite resistance protein [Vibrio mexicanus]|uniref:tellurite resistance TerB family protein n=1 Tax=Vibrio mexicanus TaxID=1004326 RepID=UPI00063C8385|nr:TerB family tellurite resistance protein [Vibrio mexicanus]